LRYLILTNNFNFEGLLPDVHGTGTNAGAYVDQALRAGVDKIVFVRCAYDSLSGHLFAPYTNQFIDTYLTNGTLHQQQLERVVTQPDILFSSADLGHGAFPTPPVLRTGTTNWLSFAAPGANGPGIIRPQVQIVFHQFDFRIETADSLTNSTIRIEDVEDYRWGSFDLSTNASLVYPAGSAPPSTNQLNVQLEMTFANVAAPVSYHWQLPVALGGYAAIETSTNLVNWDQVLQIMNHGWPWIWRHQVSQAQRYFRVVAQ
jgi:hypothetical protein